MDEIRVESEEFSIKENYFKKKTLNFSCKNYSHDFDISVKQAEKLIVILQNFINKNKAAKNGN